MPYDDVSALAIDGSNIWIGIGTYWWCGGLAKFDRTNWTVYNRSNSGLPDNWVQALAIDGSDIWIGTGTYWCYGGLAVYTGEQGIEEITSHPILHLAQNYPNPFNSSTSIRYVLPKNDFVRLAIYNISGQLVRTLVKGEEFTGTHTVSWNGMDEQGRSISSGIYFYCLETGNLKSTGKMLLLK